MSDKAPGRASQNKFIPPDAGFLAHLPETAILRRLAILQPALGHLPDFPVDPLEHQYSPPGVDDNRPGAAAVFRFVHSVPFVQILFLNPF